MTLNDYFDKIICINLDKRTDKWAQCLALFHTFDMTVERFRGHDLTDGWGNDGCTASHRGVFELICHHGWKRTLILEDDWYTTHFNMQQMFSGMIGDVPEDWVMLYLGGHYGEPPQARVSPNVIRIGRMMTTSSYAVTLPFAREMVTKICGTGPIDTLFFEAHQTRPCYIFQPRLMVQKPGFSDIQQRDCDNQQCMEDCNHENMV